MLLFWGKFDCYSIFSIVRIDLVIGGDFIEFLMRFEGLSFLLEGCGIHILQVDDIKVHGGIKYLKFLRRFVVEREPT